MRFKLPEAFEKRMREQLGPSFDAYMASFDEERTYAARINTLKTDLETLREAAPFSMTEIPWIRDGVFLESTSGASKSPLYAAGLYYLQDPSAMAPSSRLPIEEGDFVLDLCAAPGGKSVALACALKGKGFLLANDISRSRGKALLKNLELFGVKNAFVSTEDSKSLRRMYGASFDKILLDAPCSGEGMFRKEPAILPYWEKKGPAEYALIQEELLEDCYAMLKHNGCILYSTCTYSYEEDEGQVLRFLERHKDLELLPMEEIPGAVHGTHLEPVMTLYPHMLRGEGQFLALIRKTGGEDSLPPVNDELKSRKISKAEYEAFLEEAREVRIPLPKDRLYAKDEYLYLLPEAHPVIYKGLFLMRSGLLLGEWKKSGRFELSTAFALSVKKDEYGATHELTEDEAVRYLKGESLMSTYNGPKRKTLLLYKGQPLGFGNEQKGRIKNQYLASWRWNS